MNLSWIGGSVVRWLFGKTNATVFIYQMLVIVITKIDMRAKTYIVFETCNQQKIGMKVTKSL